MNQIKHEERYFEDSQAASLQTIWRAIQQSKWIILLITAIFTALGFVGSLTLTPMYSSDLLLNTNQGQANLGVASSIMGLMGDISFIRPTAAPAQVESVLLQSRYLLTPVVKRLNLDIMASPRYFPWLGHISANKYKGNGLAHPLLGLKHYAWGGEEIKVVQLHVAPEYLGKPLRLIAGENGSYQLQDSLGNFILQGQVGQLLSSSPNNPAVQIKVAALKARPGTYFSVEQLTLNQAINTLKTGLMVNEQGDNQSTGLLQITYKSPSPDLTISVLNTLADVAFKAGVVHQQHEAQQTLKFLDKQLPLIRESIHKAEVALAQYQSQTGNLDVNTQYSLGLQQLITLQNELGELKLQRTELLQKYTSNHPYVLTINDKIQSLQQQINNYQQHIRSLPLGDATSSALTRDLQAKTQLYVMLINRQQEMRVLQASVTSNVSIYSYASQPPLFVPVNKLLSIVIGLLLGLVISFSYVFIRLALHNTVSDPFYIEDTFGIPVLSMMPFSKNQRQLFKNKGKSLATEEAKPFILAVRHPYDAAIESLRSLRTTLQLFMLEAKNNIIAICGLTPGVGKSFVATNLAYVMAFSGKKVLLLDADLRRGHIHEELNVSLRPGLSNILIKEVAIKDAVQHVQENLDFISRGGQVHATAEILANCAELLQELSTLYELVIIDSAPILLLTDGILISREAGTNLMVVSAGQHTNDELKTGFGMLKKNNIVCNGVILNFQTEHKSYLYGYGYYGKYNYYYSPVKE